MGVLAGSDGKPVDDATVVIWRDDSTQGGQTGDDGTFSFHNLAPGDYFVAAIDKYAGTVAIDGFGYSRACGRESNEGHSNRRLEAAGRGEVYRQSQRYRGFALTLKLVH